MLHVTRVARFGWLDSSIHSYACSLVHSELSWWGLESSWHFMSHIRIVTVTTALDHHINVGFQLC
jgi:hypothetical protein